MSDSRTRTVLLTRSALDNAEWASELTARGFQPISCVCIETVQLPAPEELAAAIQQARWLACSSRRAVDALHNEHATLPSELQLAAVGPATAERLRAHYGRCDLQSAKGTGDDLGHALSEAGATAPIVIAAQDGLADIELALASAGHGAARFELYATHAITSPIPTEAAEADVAFFASPSAVRAFAARGQLSADCLSISLGPSTSAAMRQLQMTVHAQSQTRDLDGMLAALATTTTSQR